MISVPCAVDTWQWVAHEFAALPFALGWEGLPQAEMTIMMKWKRWKERKFGHRQDFEGKANCRLESLGENDK